MDISVIGSLLLYADSNILKQLYILFQSVKLLFLLIARIDLLIFLFLLYDPRFYLLKIVANNLLLGVRKYKSDFKIDGLVKNEKAVYLSNLFQKFSSLADFNVWILGF